MRIDVPTSGTDVDVLVVGAGGGGLSAALAASQAGSSVLLLEARRTFSEDCNTAMSTAMIPAGGSRWQRAAGVDDSAEAFLADVMAKTDGGADRAVAMALTSVAPKLVEWLADDCGLDLQLVTDFLYPGHSVHRCHTVPDRSGQSMHRHLLRVVESTDTVTLLTERRLDRLDRSGGGAWAATFVAPDGSADTVRVGSVILATNGFGADPDRVARLMPEIADGLYFGGPSSAGDALRIGETLGADTGCLDAYQGHGSVATPHGVIVTWATVMHGGVVVNTEGRRFADEAHGYSEFAREVLAQPGRVAWTVFDERVHEACGVFADYQRLVEVGALRRAATVGELATVIGCPEPALAATMTAARVAAAGIERDPFGRTSWEAPLSGGYLAVKVTGALFHTQGGLCVDADAAVLAGGEPIGGLYAVGGAAIGMSGHGPAGYLAGNGLLAALGLGYLAGRAAARVSAGG
jgi:fumarate reductase flavoprotein subunit